MKKAITTLKRMATEEDGAGMVEYAIGTALIAAAVLIAVGLFTGKLGGAFDSIGSSLDSAG